MQVYDIPNIDLDLKVVRTNLPPRTIMRGPGFMDAAMLIEQVLEHVAGTLGADPAAVRQLNFLQAPNAAPKPQSQPSAEGTIFFLLCFFVDVTHPYHQFKQDKRAIL